MKAFLTIKWTSKMETAAYEKLHIKPKEKEQTSEMIYVIDAIQH